MKKRILSLLLALVTVLSLAAPAYAQSGEAEAAAPVAAAAQLAEPQLKSVSNEVTGVKVTWKAVSGASMYRVFYRTWDSDWKKAGDTADTSYIWTGAKNDTYYEFTVRCVSADGKKYTSSYDDWGLGIEYYSAPKITSLTNTPNGVALSWGEVEGIWSYRVFYKTEGGSWKKAGDADTTSFLWTGAKKNTKYSFTVRCLHYIGGSDYLSGFDPVGKSITYVPTQLATPKVSAAVNADGDIEIKWNAVPGAENYRVFYKTTGGWKKLVDTTEAGLVWDWGSVEDLWPESGTEYSFTVRCLSADGTKYTSSYDADGKSVYYLNTPYIYLQDSVKTGVYLCWYPVEGTCKYRVFYNDGNGWKKAGDTMYTEYVWKGAKEGARYRFTVRCLSPDGKSYASGFDQWTEYITYKKPSDQLATPKINSVTLGELGITIEWGAVEDASRYRVFYKTGSGGWKKLGDTTDTGYWWSIWDETETGATLESGKTYSFTVRCVTADGKDYLSAYDTVGKSILYIPTPYIQEVYNLSNGMSISWASRYQAAKYRLFYRTGGGSWTKLADVTGENHDGWSEGIYVWTGAKAGKTYEFTIRCLDREGKYVGTYSDYSDSYLYTKPAGVASGICGDGLTWDLSRDGVLTISGDGFMDYRYNWSDVWDQVKSVTIGSEVRSVIPSAMNFPNAAKFTVEAGNQDLSASGGVLFNKNKTTLLAYPCGKPDASYTIPSTVKTVNSYAFSHNCSKLTQITVPASVTEISPIALLAGSLTAIKVDSGSKSYASADGVLFNKAKTELLFYPRGKTASNYKTPSGVTAIGSDAFYNNRYLESVTVSKGVTSIGVDAFFATNLKSVTLPSTLRFIGAYAFANTNVTSVTIPKSVTSIGAHAFTTWDGSKVTISGTKGTAAEAYAKNYNCTFKAVG